MAHLATLSISIQFLSFGDLSIPFVLSLQMISCLESNLFISDNDGRNRRIKRDYNFEKQISIAIVLLEYGSNLESTDENEFESFGLNNFI
jgi:hypothetical protein